MMSYSAFKTPKGCCQKALAFNSIPHSDPPPKTSQSWRETEILHFSVAGCHLQAQYAGVFWPHAATPLCQNEDQEKNKKQNQNHDNNMESIFNIIRGKFPW